MKTLYELSRASALIGLLLLGLQVTQVESGILDGTPLDNTPFDPGTWPNPQPPEKIDKRTKTSPILEKWAHLGGKGGFLGQPVQGKPRDKELVTPDKVGRFVHFQGGSIYWSPSSGAHEVHGRIRETWARLGWERSFLGYPLTDESVTPDKVGRYNHFQGGSIYWTMQTGAREVHGAIRDKWASMGWERSFLRYPISDEVVLPDGRGRRSIFQGGYIEWYREKGAIAYPRRPIIPVRANRSQADLRSGRRPAL